MITYKTHDPLLYSCVRLLVNPMSGRWGGREVGRWGVARWGGGVQGEVGSCEVGRWGGGVQGEVGRSCLLPIA